MIMVVVDACAGEPRLALVVRSHARVHAAQHIRPGGREGARLETPKDEWWREEDSLELLRGEASVVVLHKPAPAHLPLRCASQHPLPPAPRPSTRQAALAA